MPADETVYLGLVAGANRRFSSPTIGQEIAELSSILKALRKLEDEYPRRTAGKVSWPQIPGVKKSLRRWEINSGRFAPVLWAALTVVTLAAAGWFLLYMRSPDQTPAPSAELPDMPLPVVSSQQQRSAAASAPQTTVRRPAEKRAGIEPRRRTVQGAAKAGSAAAAVARTPKDRKKRRPRPPLPVDQAGTQTGADVAVMQTGLELQAVSWSPDPKNRIAVINGSIVREGGLIEGYAVVRIEEDEILVRKGLSQWRLVFNLKK